jgi:hypothetical protein
LGEYIYGVFACESVNGGKGARGKGARGKGARGKCGGLRRLGVFFEVADDEGAAWVVDAVKGVYNGLIIIYYLTVLKLVGGGIGR